MKIEPTLEDWEAMKATAEDILKSAKKDYILWSNVLKEVECQIKTMSKVEGKNIKSVTSLDKQDTQ